MGPLNSTSSDKFQRNPPPNSLKQARNQTNLTEINEQVAGDVIEIRMTQRKSHQKELESRKYSKPKRDYSSCSVRVEWLLICNRKWCLAPKVEFEKGAVFRLARSVQSSSWKRRKNKKGYLLVCPSNLFIYYDLVYY